MNNIPNEFKINKQINHKEYLIDGIISKWDGNQTNVYSTLLCDKDDKEPYLLGNTPEMSGEYALKALEAAHSAFNFGQGVWPTMKVYERIQCMETFVEKMKEHREEVVKLLMWEICKNKSVVLIDYVLNTGSTLIYAVTYFLNIEIQKIQDI